MRSAALAAGLGLTLCLAGAGFAASPLYLPGVALLLIAGAAVLWVCVAANGARLARSVGSPSVEEGALLPITVRLARSRVPLPGAEVHAWADGPALPVTRSGAAALRSGVRFARRGRHRLAPASLIVSDPLGLCTRAVVSAADEVLVLPRVERVRFAPGGGGEPAILGRQLTRAGDPGASEVDSLRPHRPGTPASRIHWPTVARTTTLMERALVADGDQAPLVVVDPREPSSAGALDDAVRAAASLCVHLARLGGCALLLPGDRTPTHIGPSLSSFGECHARLALLQPDAGGPPLGCVSGAGAVLWVTAGRARAPTLGALRAPVRYLVSPHVRGAWPVHFTVARCSGQRLGDGVWRERAA